MTISQGIGTDFSADGYQSDWFGNQIVPTPVDMDLFGDLIPHAIVRANRTHYIYTRQTRPSFLMELIDKSEHLFYTEPHAGVGLHRPQRLFAKSLTNSCSLESPSTLTCRPRESTSRPPPRNAPLYPLAAT